MTLVKEELLEEIRKDLNENYLECVQVIKYVNKVIDQVNTELKARRLHVKKAKDKMKRIEKILKGLDPKWEPPKEVKK